MRNSIFYIFSLLFLLLSCGETKKEKRGITLDNCPIVAYKEDSLTILDFSLVKDTFSFPMSALLSTFEVIPLENTEEALLGFTSAYAISENYIGLDNILADYKLFSRKGEYIRTITKVGQGPDEYLVSIYDSYIDEKRHKIYLLPGMTKKLLVFDLEGNPLEHIPFPFTVHKGRFKIDAEKEELIMMALPFEDTPYAIWHQDFKGNILQAIDAGHFVINPGDYSNEVNESLNTNSIDYSLFYWYPPRADTLYHYHTEKNVLSPVFTTKWKGDGVIRHDYSELSEHYLIRTFYQSASPVHVPQNPQILIDKNSLRGCYVKFRFNVLGNIEGPSFLSFNRGYCIANMFPHELKEQLQKALAKPEGLSTEMLERMKQLNNRITEDDNNILLIGKLKGSE